MYTGTWHYFVAEMTDLGTPLIVNLAELHRFCVDHSTAVLMRGSHVRISHCFFGVYLLDVFLQCLYWCLLIVQCVRTSHRPAIFVLIYLLIDAAMLLL